MRRMRAVIKKEFRQIGRDRLSLGMLIFVPALLLVLYGYALSFDVKHIRVAVLDRDQTPESRQLQESLFSNPYFERKMTLARVQEADEVLDHGRVRAVLNIPRNYAADLARGGDVDLQVLIDGADANTAAATVGYMDALADRATHRARQAMIGAGAAAPILPQVTIEPRIWFNPELLSARFLVPGLIGMLLMLSSVIATSLSIVKEKEQETMEQMMVSPLQPEELIIGKTIPYVVICLATMAMILALGYFLFGVEVRGSFLLLGLVTVVFLFAALGLGVLISSATRSQQMAFQIAVITSLLPAILLSGFIFPIQNMPLPVQMVTMLVIPRYFMACLRAIIMKGAGFMDIWPQIAGMLALGVLFNVLAVKNTRKTV